MTIKYVIISGGGTSGLGLYGIIKNLCNKDFMNLNDIKSIFATSCGCMLGLVLVLKMEWDIMDDYLIKRPWEEVFNIHPENIFHIFDKKGLLNSNTIKEIINPLLRSKNLSENITLLELFEYSKIDFHLYTVNVNEEIPIMVDLSYKTHPHLELYKAISMSTAIPVIFEPIFMDNGCYVDGGYLNNFPLNYAVNHLKLEKDNKYDDNELLGIKSKNDISNFEIKEESGLLNYLLNLLIKIGKIIDTKNEYCTIKNIIVFKDSKNNIENWKDVVLKKELREQMIESGEKISQEFIEQGELHSP